MSFITAQRGAWIMCLAGTLGLALGFVFARVQMFQSYWLAWLFWSGLSLGALPLRNLQVLTGGRWAVLLQPPTRAAIATLPLAGLLLLPVALGFAHVFPWASASFESQPHHHAFLQERWFWVRSALYFGVLIAFARAVRAPSRWPAGLHGASALAYVLCMNFASTDWVMSLEPQWYSTIYAVIFMVGQFLSALALCSFVALIRAEDGELSAPLARDVGNLLLAFVIFWAYVSFSQFLIIWSGNLPREISWYVHRRNGGWPAVALILGLCQFLLPFALLLSRKVKQNRRRLAVVALVILLANFLHLLWLVVPAYSPGAVRVHWLDFAAFLAVGGAWCTAFLKGAARE